MRPCDMNHVCRSKHGTFFGTLEIASSGLGLGLLVLSLIVGLCLCVTLPVTMYLPKGLEGRLRCPKDANPPLTFIIWKKNDKILDSDDRVAIDDQGTLVISSVIASDEGNYTCTPYSPLWNVFNSFSLRLIVKDLPSFIVRPLPVYHRRLGQTVFMPCVADGDPKPVISWQKADGTFPPTTKTLQDGGNLTIVQLSEEERGTYECIARNVVTSIITTTLLIVQLAIHSAPYNVIVEVTESTARVSWLPPYIEEGQHYEYELWCQSQDDSAKDIWQRFDAIPDNVTTVTVYNLQPKTNYRLKIMSNYSGRPHFSREKLVRTKPKELPFPDEGDEDDEDINSGESSGSTPLPDRTIVPSTAGYRPMPPVKVMVQELRNNSINISWLASRRSPVPVQYFVVQYRTFGQWVPLSGRIDAGQTHYEWKVPSLGAEYYFRVLSYGHDSHSEPSATVIFTRTDPLKKSVSGGTVGGLVGGIVVFISLVALVLVAFKVYKIRAKKKRETTLASTEYASMSINRTLEGRASPILETLSIISNHSQIRNNDHEMRQCHETPI